MHRSSFAETNSEDDDGNQKRVANVSTDSAMGNTSVDESSFVDNSFLNTISEKNPKYVGNTTKLLKSAVLRKETARNTASNARRSALDDLSDDNEDGSERRLLDADSHSDNSDDEEVCE